MGTREKSVKRYVVRLGAEEREQLEALIRKGKSPAQRLLKARILLKADISEAGDGWSDSKIIAALETSASMVYRVRKQLVEEGLEAVLSRKQRATPAVPPIFDGEKEAKLIALACSKPPKGRVRWTLRLLENKVVELKIVDRASDSTIGRVLKKTLSSPIGANNGSFRPRPTAHSSPRWRTCWPSMRGRATLIDRWSAWTRAQSNSSPRRGCRSR
jgi:transposase